MDRRLDALDQLFAEDHQILDNFMDFLQEKQVATPYTPFIGCPATPPFLDQPYTPQVPHQYNGYPQSNQNSYSSSMTASSPESYTDHQTSALSPSSASSCCSSRPESAYSSSSETYCPSDCSPSTSSSSSNDSNVFHFPSKPVSEHRQKRPIRRTSRASAAASPKSPVTPAIRGRGRPMKDNSDGDQTVIRKRIYAREYRKKNQKTHDELFACLIDFYKVASSNGINFAKMFPQHKSVVTEILKNL